MSLPGFFDHCQAASEALVEWMGIYHQGGSVLSDYADQNQAEADAARQYLKKAATELEAACKLSESVIQEVSDDVATDILAVTTAAKRDVREFFHCWQKHNESLLWVAVRERIKLGPKGVKTVDLPSEFYLELVELAFGRVLDMFKAEGRPRDHFWKVVEIADNAGVYELTSEEKIDSLVADARRQIEQRIPHPAQQKDQPKKEQAVASAMTVTITTQDACKMLDRHKSTLKRWADHAGIEKVANNVWSKSDIEKLARLRGIEL